MVRTPPPFETSCSAGGRGAAAKNAMATTQTRRFRALMIVLLSLASRRRLRRLHFELGHHVVILVRSVVAVHDVSPVEVPELVSNHDFLVRPHPDRVFEALELAGPRRAAFNLDHPEPSQRQVDRVAPSARMHLQAP